MLQILGYHNHNFFCDGLQSPEDYIQFAINQNVKAIGFASHAPFFFENIWSIQPDKLLDYVNTIERLKLKYADKIDVFKSLEIDFLPGMIQPFNYFVEALNLDYTVGSIHYILHPITNDLLFIDGPQENFLNQMKLVFNNDFEFAVKSYFNQTKEMILTQKPTIIGHIDKIIMNASPYILENQQYPNWYVDELKDVLLMAANEGIIVELNLRGLIKNKWSTSFPDEYFLSYCHQIGLKMIISTDAHQPQEVDAFYQHGLRLLRNAGFTHLMKLDSKGWISYSI